MDNGFLLACAGVIGMVILAGYAISCARQGEIGYFILFVILTMLMGAITSPSKLIKRG